jgi:hypothetical protein
MFGQNDSPCAEPNTHSGQRPRSFRESGIVLPACNVYPPNMRGNYRAANKLTMCICTFLYKSVDLYVYVQT